jgi:cis-3-alkyl-4-acyloxetan-2-one decarboxylase
MDVSAPPPLPDWLEAMLPFRRYLVDVDGVNLHVMEQGEGRPVLLVHGNPTWGFLYRRVARELAGDPLRVIVPDLPGLGLSDRVPAADHTLARHMRRFGRLVDLLDLDDVILVVHDWGGAIGTGGFVGREERLGGLVVLNTVLGPPKPGFRPTTFHRLARIPVVSDLLFRGLGFPQRMLWFAQGDRAGIRGKVARGYAYPLRGLRRNVAPLALTRMVPDSLDHPSVPQLQQVADLVDAYDGPAAIVWGDRDPILGKVRERIARSLPQAAVTRTRGGHFLQEEHPAEIAAAIRSLA